MAKTGVSNDLLGKTVGPAYYDQKWDNIESKFVPDLTRPMGGWPTGFGPSLDGKFTAKITAVWVEAGTVKVALVDPHGNMSDAFLSSLKLIQK